tara:strand:- start:1717 stop:2316 length:600 start_codon:yes stop_codon:yes gene_type:complete
MKNTFLLLVLLTSFCAASQEKEKPIYLSKDQSLGLINAINMQVVNTTTDQCLTNIERVKQELRLKLEQSDVKVYDEPLGGNASAVDLVISANGWKPNNYGCVGNFSLNVYYFGYHAFNESFIRKQTTLLLKSSLATSSTDLNAMFSDFAIENIAKLSADIISARRDTDVVKFFEGNPQLKEVRTVKEIQVLVETLLKEF